MRLKKYATALYRRLTPDSGTRALLLVPILGIVLVLLAGVVLGVIHGAEAAMAGEKLAVGELQQVEQEVWSSLADSGPLQRAIGGLLHWLVVLMVALTILAAQLGYALPVLGYPASWVGTALPGLFILLLALQLVRIIEVGWEKYAEA